MPFLSRKSGTSRKLLAGKKLIPLAIFISLAQKLLTFHKILGSFQKIYELETVFYGKINHVLVYRVILRKLAFLLRKMIHISPIHLHTINR